MTGIPKAVVYDIKYRITSVLNGSGKRTQRNRHYFEAANLINKQKDDAIVLSFLGPQLKETKDPYEELQQSFDYFQRKMGDFISAIMERKYTEMTRVVEELKKENQELKKTLELFREKAKTSNWVSHLKDKFDH